jgi:hypothetical protein
VRHEIFFGEGCEGDCGRVRSGCEATLSGGRTIVKPVHINCFYFLVVEIVEIIAFSNFKINT